MMPFSMINEEITAEQLKSYTKSLQDILEYKFTYGSDPSDEVLKNILHSTIKMLGKCRSPWKDCYVYHSTFNFFAKMDFSSQKFIGKILDSAVMDYIDAALNKSPSYVIEEAISAVFNLLTLAGDENIPQFHGLPFIQYIFFYISYSHKSDCHLQSIAKLATQTLELLYQKSEEVLARKRLNNERLISPSSSFCYE